MALLSESESRSTIQSDNLWKYSAILLLFIVVVESLFLALVPTPEIVKVTSYLLYDDEWDTWHGRVKGGDEDGRYYFDFHVKNTGNVPIVPFAETSAGARIDYEFEYTYSSSPAIMPGEVRSCRLRWTVTSTSTSFTVYVKARGV